MDREKLIEQIMRDAEKEGEPLTREEASEIAEMEIKANGLKNYTQAEVEKKPRKKREVKKDATKIEIIKEIYNLLLTTELSDVIIENEQREITFTLNNENYSLVLTKHRPKKKEV